ncbi:MAG: AAA family ATPase, partial [Chloroflexi bacterium]|nr:AAA family ATPase [Chloroflexota bacterium]
HHPFGHPDILLIEEPEIFLHPSLETSMMRYLKRISSNCQVFISTHSTNFLDTGEMNNIYLVSRMNSTHIQLLDYEEALALIPKELGIRLSSLFMFDRLVFVEGPSDEAVIREWASLLRVNFSQHNVGFVQMGGVRNFTHFAAQATLSFLSKRQVRIWFIIDHDERDNAEIARLKELVGQNAAVKVLEAREIENYLINARAVREFISQKRQMSGNPITNELPSEADINMTIDKSADELRQLAIDKHVVRVLCHPVYPNTKSLFDGAVNTTIAERIVTEIDRLVADLQETKADIQRVYQDHTHRLDSIWPNKKL